MKNLLLKEELRAIFTNKKLLIPIIAVLFVPVLYTGMFLWAFWDPYSKLDQLPVAVVNSDTGARFDGDQLKLGDDLVKKLKGSKEFGFHVVDKKVGYQGLKNEKYYMLIEIPEDFSKNAATLLDNHPKKMKLVYAPNESYNFLSAQIGGTAAEKIKTAVAQKVTETYAETMFSKVKQLADGMNKASDGAGQLKDGSVDVRNGANDLNDGLATLAKKSIEFNNGMQDANAGSKKLASGSKDLYNGLATLAEKSIAFNKGMQNAHSGTDQIATGSKNLADGLGQLEEGHKQLETASGQLANGSKELSAKLKEANTGIQKMDGKMPVLVNGTKDLQSGSEELSKGLSQWQQGSNTAVTGSEQVHQGIVALKEQLGSLIQSPLLAALPAEQKAALVQGLQDLETGSANLEAGTKTLNQSAGVLSGGAAKLADNLSVLYQGQMAMQQGLSQLAAGSTQLVAGADKLATGEGNFVVGMQQFGQKFTEAKGGADQLAAGSSSLSNGMNQLADGSSAFSAGAGQLENGSKELTAGATSLSGGMTQLADGSKAITSGASQLASGSSQLANGTNDLNNGTEELAGKLADGAKEASSVHPNKKTYSMMADPVKLDNEKINKVPNYGTGFAPYFLSLGLFVGALLISIVFPLREPATVPVSGFNWFAGKLAVMAIVGVIQALFADFILLSVLGLHVQNIPGFILYTILTSLTFATLIQLLVSIFADAGRFLAIIILILQLTTSAGTFPLQLIPNFLQHFNAYLPMTYSVQGFKAVISSGNLGVLWQNASILLFFSAIFMIGSYAYFSMRHRHDYKVVEN